MTKGRMISSGTFEDEWFGGLSLFDRIIWIGVITACADDQGRLLNNAALIRNHIFPFEDTPLENINNSIIKLVQDKKILAYKSLDNKDLLQIINWWEYQAPSWASPSKYLAPEGWIDRIKIHTVGNKVHTENWDSRGGFVPTQLPTTLPTPLHKPIEKGEGEGEGEVQVRNGGIFSLYENSIGIVPHNLVEELKQAEKDFPPTWQAEAFKIAASRNKRSWGYVRGILRRFVNEGFRPDGGNSPPDIDPRNIPTEVY